MHDVGGSDAERPHPRGDPGRSRGAAADTLSSIEWLQFTDQVLDLGSHIEPVPPSGGNIGLGAGGSSGVGGVLVQVPLVMLPIIQEVMAI